MGTLHYGNIQSVFSNQHGQAMIAYGDPPNQKGYIGDPGTFLENQSLSMGRLWPDPTNSYYGLIWFSGIGADGDSIVTFRDWHDGKVGQGPYLGWYGPFVAA